MVAKYSKGYYESNLEKDFEEFWTFCIKQALFPYVKTANVN